MVPATATAINRRRLVIVSFFSTVTDIQPKDFLLLHPGKEIVAEKQR